MVTLTILIHCSCCWYAMCCKISLHYPLMMIILAMPLKHSCSFVVHFCVAANIYTLIVMKVRLCDEHASMQRQFLAIICCH